MRSPRLLTNLQLVQLGVAGSLLVLCVAVAYLFHTTQALIRDIKWVGATHEMLAEIEQVAVLTKDIAAGSRGYVITGREFFLPPYTKALAEMDTEVEDVQRLITTDPALTKRLDELRGTIKAEIQFSGKMVEIRRQQGPEAAMQLVDSGQGQKILDHLDQTLESMRQVGQRQLQEREHEANRSVQKELVVIVLAGLLSLLLIGATSVLLHRDIRARDRLEKALLMVSEREQRSVGRDLHDSLCQQLTGVGLLVQALGNRLLPSHNAEAGQAGTIERLINQANQSARNIARGLAPVGIQANGLASALEELAAYMRSVYGKDCVFECPVPVSVHDNECATHVYRIAQEALQNAVRHGHASTLHVGLVHSGTMIRLEICDDGDGLKHSRGGGTGLGLDIMRARAKALGGVLAIHENAPHGTIVTCLFPSSIHTPSTAQAPEDDANLDQGIYEEI